MSDVQSNHISDDEWRVVDGHRVLGWILDISGCDESGKTVGHLYAAFVPGPKRLIQVANGDRSHTGKSDKRRRGLKTNRRLIGSARYKTEAQSVKAFSKALGLIVQSENVS